jgi:hypothetical protein
LDNTLEVEQLEYRKALAKWQNATRAAELQYQSDLKRYEDQKLALQDLFETFVRVVAERPTKTDDDKKCDRASLFLYGLRYKQNWIVDAFWEGAEDVTRAHLHLMHFVAEDVWHACDVDTTMKRHDQDWGAWRTSLRLPEGPKITPHAKAFLEAKPPCQVGLRQTNASETIANAMTALIPAITDPVILNAGLTVLPWCPTLMASIAMHDATTASPDTALGRMFYLLCGIASEEHVCKALFSWTHLKPIADQPQVVAEAGVKEDTPSKEDSSEKEAVSLKQDALAMEMFFWKYLMKAFLTKNVPAMQLLLSFHPTIRKPGENRLQTFREHQQNVQGWLCTIVYLACARDHQVFHCLKGLKEALVRREKLERLCASLTSTLGSIIPELGSIQVLNGLITGYVGGSDGNNLMMYRKQRWGAFGDLSENDVLLLQKEEEETKGRQERLLVKRS